MNIYSIIRLRAIDRGMGWNPVAGKELESWSRGIRLPEEWNYFAQNEPRLGIDNPLRFVPVLSKANYLVRYRLGM
jgi:hypothetical protein